MSRRRKSINIEIDDLRSLIETAFDYGVAGTLPKDKLLSVFDHLIIECL